jgi:hypothetical protein
MLVMPVLDEGGLGGVDGEGNEVKEKVDGEEYCGCGGCCGG